MVDRESLRDRFQELHGTEPRIFAAPGRVNLIGEHTDYNDGFVLPAAIDRDTAVAAALRDDRTIRVHSINRGETREIDLDAPRLTTGGDWMNYIEGMARVLESHGVRLRGAELLLESDVPPGGGLSSSAALELAVGMALTSLAEVEIDGVQLALAGQEAEHTYVGTKCGIMDQLVAALGERGHALLIDCRTLHVTAIPVDSSAAALVICDTGVKHSLASSEYNTRRAECEEGVAMLRKVLPDIAALRDVSPEELERFGDILPDPIGRRCRHVVAENMRTIMAAAALETGSFEKMGELMGESHRSLRDDYEVSCRELDLMVEIAGEIDGVFGARMTGGGFGGCTVNFVRPASVARFLDEVSRRYAEATGIEPTIHVTEIGEGAREERRE